MKVTLKDNGGTHTMTIAKNAAITSDRRKVNLEDLKPGNHVKLTAHGKRGIVKVEAFSKSE